jgi:VanZ family protein
MERCLNVSNVMLYAQIICRASAGTLLIIIAVISLVPAQYRPATVLPHVLEHLPIFLATGVVFGVGYPERRLFQFVALLSFTAAIELAQLLIPGRHARLSDFLVDALGISAGLLIGSFALAKLAQSQPLERATSRSARG